MLYRWFTEIFIILSVMWRMVSKIWVRVNRAKWLGRTGSLWFRSGDTSASMTWFTIDLLYYLNIIVCLVSKFAGAQIHVAARHLLTMCRTPFRKPSLRVEHRG